MTVAESADAPEGTDSEPAVEPRDEGPDEPEDDAADVGVPEEAVVVGESRPTRRWHGVTAFALVALGVGVLASSPGLLLASAFGLAFAGYGAVTTAPEAEFALDRTVSTTEPDPGEEVTVTVTATNESGSYLPDVRIVDGVPKRLPVTEGTPRHGTTLRPGSEATFSYTVVAGRGDHRFDPPTALVRDLSGASERIVTVPSTDRITCKPSIPATAPSFPLRTKTSQYTGRFPADTGGPGVEFYSTREYRPGDPLSRIDWRRTARTGELTTVEYRVERTVRIVLVVDTRAGAYVAPDRHGVTAVDRGVDAAGTIYTALTSEGHDVGLATLGPVDCWVPPGSSDEHRVRIQETLGGHDALSPDPHDEETDLYGATERLKGHLPADVQVVVLTPLLDRRVIAATLRLDAHGYPATVVSPDVTSIGSPGHTYEAIQRRLRIGDLRLRGVPVIDWQPEEDFDHALAGAQQRWSR